MLFVNLQVSIARALNFENFFDRLKGSNDVKRSLTMDCTWMYSTDLEMCPVRA